MNPEKIKIDIRLPVRIEQKEKWYVSSCPVLDVFSQGSNPKEARDNLIEAVTLFLVTCLEHGTLETVLRECGFDTVSGSITEASGPAEDKNEYMDIPLYLLSNPSGQARCHA